MGFGRETLTAGQTVTQQFLRWRFAIATLILLTTLSASALTVVWILKSQSARANYVIAFHQLGAAATDLQRQLALLSMAGDGISSDGPGANRDSARAAFVDLLTEFRAAAYAAGHGPVDIAGVTAASKPHDHLDDLDAEFGIDAAAAAAERKLEPGAMCETLSAIWVGGDGRSGARGGVGLEISVARYLRSAMPVVTGRGPLSDEDRLQLRLADSIMEEQLAPMLERVSEILAGALNRAAARATTYVVILSGLGIAAALLNLVWIFRPLGRAILASQMEITAQRDNALVAAQAKRNFLSVVSHELRTPMNGVLGFASLLLASDMKPEHRKQVEIIQSSGKSLLALVNNILDFSKLEAGSLKLEEEIFSIEEVVTRVVDLLRGTALEKSLEMSVHFDAALPEKMKGDGYRLGQVLTNLVGNAIKFTDRGGVAIEVLKIPRGASGADSDGSPALQLSVSDTGIGVPQDKAEQIFERFVQVDDSSIRKQEGTGLGLSICRQLVEQMGGRVWVEGRPGGGSTFFVRIPLAAVEQPAGEAEWRDAVVAEMSGCRVLVVDGRIDNRRFLRLQLESCGVRVDDAADAAAALQKLQAGLKDSAYAAAIIDHALPDMEGAELARRIRANANLSHLRLVLTAPPAASDVEAMRELAFDAVLETPVLPRPLLGALRNSVARGAAGWANGAADAAPEAGGVSVTVGSETPGSRPGQERARAG